MVYYCYAKLRTAVVDATLAVIVTHVVVCDSVQNTLVHIEGWGSGFRVSGCAPLTQPLHPVCQITPGTGAETGFHVRVVGWVALQTGKRSAVSFPVGPGEKATCVQHFFFLHFVNYKNMKQVTNIFGYTHVAVDDSR